MYLFVEVMAIVLPLLAWFFAVDYCMNRYAKLIDVDKVSKKFTSFQSKVPTLGPDFGETHYIITGGSGFIGSWIARFLLLRSDKNITVLDENPSAPGDLTKHGVRVVKCDLLDKEDLETALNGLKISGKKTVVVFHAAVIQRYFLSWFSYHATVADKNVEIAQNLVDVFNDFSRSTSIPVVFVNVSDAVSHRKPVSWWKFWNYKSWLSQTSAPTPKEAYISSYAKSKSDAEELILSANDGKNFVSASLDPMGIVCGYYGDPLLSPCLYYKGALNHGWDVPYAFLHVEDLARVALILESKLRIKNTTAKVQGKSYMISNGQLIRFEDMFNLINKTMEVKSIKINPALVLVISYGIEYLASVLPSGRNGWKKKDDSLFSGRWWSLTSGRFDTIQLAQLPDEARIQETKDVLGFEAARTIEDTIQTTVDDFIQIEKHMIEMKKAKKAQQEQ